MVRICALFATIMLVFLIGTIRYQWQLNSENRVCNTVHISIKKQTIASAPRVPTRLL